MTTNPDTTYHVLSMIAVGTNLFVCFGVSIPLAIRNRPESRLSV